VGKEVGRAVDKLYLRSMVEKWELGWVTWLGNDQQEYAVKTG